MDNATGVLLYGNLYANNSQRHPLAKGGAWVAVVNNLIYNPGIQAIGYRLPETLWHGRKFETGRLDIVGNFMRAGPNTQRGLPLLTLEGVGDLETYLSDNINLDREGKAAPICSKNGAAKGDLLICPAHVYWPEGLVALPSEQVAEFVYKNVGARPWDRDVVDERIIRQTRESTGRIIDSEQEVGGYPIVEATRERFDPEQWDLETMVRH